MPVITYKDKYYISTDFKYSKKYWKEFFELYMSKYGNIEYSERLFI